MATSKWVYEKATGKFLFGGFFDPQFNVVTQGVVQFQDSDPNPDIRLHRFDAVLGKRLATVDEIIEYDLTLKDTTAQRDFDDVKMAKALAIVMLSEINILRSALSLPARTLLQLKNAILNEYKQLL